MSHSACHNPSPRSCSCGIAFSIVTTRPGIFAWIAINAALATGLCLCGIVDEPPRPSSMASETSPTSACINNATSLPNFESVPVRMASTCTIAVRLSRCVCHGSEGSARSRLRARPVETEPPTDPRDAKVPTAPPNCNTSVRTASALIRSRSRRNAARIPANFSPSVVGGPDCSQVLPCITASLCFLTCSSSAESNLPIAASSNCKAFLICSTSAVSRTSWLVAPR